MSSRIVFDISGQQYSLNNILIGFLDFFFVGSQQKACLRYPHLVIMRLPLWLPHHSPWQPWTLMIHLLSLKDHDPAA